MLQFFFFMPGEVLTASLHFYPENFKRGRKDVPSHTAPTALQWVDSRKCLHNFILRSLFDKTLPSSPSADKVSLGSLVDDLQKQACAWELLDSSSFFRAGKDAKAFIQVGSFFHFSV